MTDEQIVKALEMCATGECTRECPFYNFGSKQCADVLFCSIPDLVKRLQQENESLKRENTLLKDSWKPIEYDPLPSFIPEPCKSCSNHPSNGGSGICNCTLGGESIIC